jgi:hypothetical protein
MRRGAEPLRVSRVSADLSEPSQGLAPFFQEALRSRRCRLSLRESRDSSDPMLAGHTTSQMGRYFRGAKGDE